MSPAIKDLFSFKDEENIYEHPKFIKHAKIVMRFIDNGIASFGEKSLQAEFIKLGKKHNMKNVTALHYNLFG